MCKHSSESRKNENRTDISHNQIHSQNYMKIS